MKTLIKEKELPVDEFKKLGLYQDGRLLLDREDTAALLAGRRTELKSMNDLEMDGFRIHQLDAKLSLSRTDDGSVKLNIHPIYKELMPHPLLSLDDSVALQKGTVSSIRKTVDDRGIERQQVIEYDEETKEFVSYHTDQVQVPVKVNGQPLTEIQQRAFRNGEIVVLEDGTRVQHTGTDSKGVRSDTKALIFSVLLDGGISYLVLRGLSNLVGNENGTQKGYTKGYNQALADMMGVQDHRTEKEKVVGGYPVGQMSDHSPDNRYGAARRQ